jgi:hypothetical protein
MNPELAKKILDVLASGDAKAALELLTELAASQLSGEPAADSGADPAAATADPPAPNPDQPEAAAASVEMDARIAALEARNAELENDARRELVVELVKLRAETPATAWKRDKAGKQTGEMVDRLAKEPIASMRERVAVLRKNAPRTPEPPASGTEAPKYAPAVLAALAKMDPAQKARFEKFQATAATRRAGYGDAQ